MSSRVVFTLALQAVGIVALLGVVLVQAGLLQDGGDFRPLLPGEADMMPPPPKLYGVGYAGWEWQWQRNDRGELLYKRLGPARVKAVITRKEANAP